MSFATILILLFIINLALTLGAGLYETRIVLPLWFSRQDNGCYTVDTAMMRRTDTGRRFWGVVTTLPLTLLTILNTGYAIWSAGPVHTVWLTGALIILAERIATFAFFIPAAIALQSNQTLSADAE